MNAAATSSARRPRPKPDTIKMDVPRVLHPDIVAIRDQIARDTGRSATLPEAWQALVDFWKENHE